MTLVFSIHLLHASLTIPNESAPGLAYRCGQATFKPLFELPKTAKRTLDGRMQGSQPGLAIATKLRCLAGSGGFLK